jgi:hypothetical protein
MAETLLTSGGEEPEAVFVAALSGRLDQAFELLDKALEQRWPIILALRAEPRFDPLRADARFSDLLRRTEAGGSYEAPKLPFRILAQPRSGLFRQTEQTRCLSLCPSS